MDSVAPPQAYGQPGSVAEKPASRPVGYCLSFSLPDEFRPDYAELS
jgi:hypothetical protein